MTTLAPAKRGNVPHAVALYASDDDLCARTLPFLEAGISRGEFVLVVVSRSAEARLRAGLDGADDLVCWRAPGASSNHLGRTSDAIARTLGTQRAAGRTMRLVVENDALGDAGRTAAYLRAEAAWNHGHSGHDGDDEVQQLCLHDLRRLPSELVEELVALHPLVVDPAGATATNETFGDPLAYAPGHPGPLTPVPAVTELDLEVHVADELSAARHAVGTAAHGLGVPQADLADVRLAAGEVMTNALLHGVGPARVRAWRWGCSVVVRVDDAGSGGAITSAGFRRPDERRPSSSGLWIARRCADIVHTGIDATGTSVELQFPVDSDHSSDAGSDRRLGDVASAYDQAPVLLSAHEAPEFVTVADNELARRLVGVGQMAGGASGERSLKPVATGRLLDVFDKVYETGEPFSAPEWRMQFVDRDGTVRDEHLDLQVTPWRHHDGTRRGVLTSAVVVTDTVRERDARGLVGSRNGSGPPPARQRGPLGDRALLEEMQTALLPANVPLLPEVEVAAAFLLAGQDPTAQLAGGDWFDAFPLGAGRLALVAGDVVGHGVVAAATMAQLRAVLRDRLVAGAGLEEAMVALDAFACGLPAAHGTTACVLVLDMASGRLEYHTAGHPPPLLVGTDGSTRYLPTTGSGPLATGSSIHVLDDMLAPDEVALLYSDGIIERPGRTPTRATLELARTAGDIVSGVVLPEDHEPTVERLCRLGIERVTQTSGHRDDISLLAAQRRRRTPDLALELDLTPAAVARARRGLAAWLDALRATTNDRLALQHAVGELVTNVIEHAFCEFAAPEGTTMTVRATLLETGVAEVTVTDTGRWRHAPPAADRGRGLALAAGIVDDLLVRREAGGTTATVRHRLERPASLTLRSGSPGPRWTDATGATVAAGGDAGALLVVSGLLDDDAARRLDTDLRRATCGGTRSLVLDLSAVELLSSAAVQVLSRNARRCERHEERLSFVAPPGTPAHHVLVLVGFDRRLAARPTGGGTDGSTGGGT